MAGSISCLQARAVTDASYVLAAGLLAEYEARVLNRAPEQTLAQLKQSIRRAVLRLDPATAEQRRQRARADRHLRVADAGHGMGWLMLLPPIDQAKACYTRADAIARTAAKPDPRTSSAPTRRWPPSSPAMPARAKRTCRSGTASHPASA